MRFAALAVTALLAAAPAIALSAAAPSAAVQTAPDASKWPVKDNLYVAHNFRFGTGETLPELNLHYLTLGTPHRNAAGHVDNAVLLLHGTGGDRRYWYLGVQVGLGIDIHVSRNVAISTDILGILRGRVDDNARYSPEFTDPQTHRVTNSSGAGLFRLGATFYW